MRDLPGARSSGAGRPAPPLTAHTDGLSRSETGVEASGASAGESRSLLCPTCFDGPRRCRWSEFHSGPAQRGRARAAPVGATGAGLLVFDGLCAGRGGQWRVRRGRGPAPCERDPGCGGRSGPGACGGGPSCACEGPPLLRGERPEPAWDADLRPAALHRPAAGALACRGVLPVLAVGVGRPAAAVLWVPELHKDGVHFHVHFAVGQYIKGR